MLKPYLEKRRHLLKTLTWRALGTMDTLILSWLISGSFRIGAAIGGAEVFTKMVLYYFHERAWYKCSFGVHRKRLEEKKMTVKRAMFIGRWQPLHNGHKWLVDQKLSAGIPVLVAVRDIPPDEKNPFTTKQTVEMLNTAYSDQDVEVVVISDIESVNYGRGVGYEINEFVPPKDIGFISATNIRECISNEDDSWKNNVDPKIHNLVEKFLRK